MTGNGFELNEETALDYMTYGMTVSGSGDETVFAVVCNHDPLSDGVGSHGGYICLTAREAIDEAKKMNRTSPEGHKCRYVPVSLILTANTIAAGFKRALELPPDDVS